MVLKIVLRSALQIAGRLGGREQEYEILRRPVRSLDLPSCLHSRDRRPQDRPEDHPQDRR